MAFSVTDWLARTFYISKEQEETAAQVAAAQQSIFDRQREEGKVGALKYLKLSEEIQDTGATFYDEQLGKSGVAGLPGIVPWWVWPLVIGAVVIYFWPVLRPFVSKVTKRL